MLGVPGTHPGFRLAVLAAAILVAIPPLLVGCSSATQPSVPASRSPAPESAPGRGRVFRHGVVAVSHPLAAEIGARVLERGGNAVDAAIAIQFALNVVEPQYSGIGGGSFMLVHLAKTDETFGLDCRETAPAGVGPGMFAPTAGDLLGTSTSGFAVGVPGTLLCLATARAHWGTKSLAEAILPAITLAGDGFRINKVLAADTASPRSTFQPETRARFHQADGSPLQVGDLLVQPDLARTLRLIAQGGPEVFYRGAIASAIVEAQKRTRVAGGEGRMSSADLAGYAVRIRKPVAGRYRGYTVVSMGPPSSGGLTLIQMLGILERFPLGDPAQGFGFGAPKTLHVMIEAMRLAFADRAVWMGDEDFSPVPKAGLIAGPYVALRSARIDPSARMRVNPTAGDPWSFEASPIRRVAPPPTDSQLDLGHTTHFSVVDAQGNFVSCTATIEAAWGTGIMVPGYGFLLNNQLTDFNLVPQVDAVRGNPGANDIAPFKRPRSSMTPTLLFKGRTPVAAYGSPGGTAIINTVLSITLNLIDHGMSIRQAVDAPRISAISPSGQVAHEEGFPGTTLAALRGLGHPVGNPGRIGSVQAVVVDPRTGEQFGGADPRRDGTVIGLSEASRR